MNERKKKLLEQRNKIENKIKAEQGKLKIINQELNNIEIKEKSESIEQLMGEIKNQGIENLDSLIQLFKQGKIKKL